MKITAGIIAVLMDRGWEWTLFDHTGQEISQVDITERKITVDAG